MIDSRNGWITCLDSEFCDLLPGTKVRLTQCLACKNRFCPVKSEVFAVCFPEWIPLSEARLNAKIIELNKKLQRRKMSLSQLCCPKKKQVSSCSARSVFCKYNQICGVNQKREGAEFIRSIRWRREMIYYVMYLDGTSEIVNRNDFVNVDIEKVERVYPGNYEVRVVSELVPLGEEQAKMNETIASFKEKYTGEVVTNEGLVEFQEWFEKASVGESAVIPEKILVPQKTYRVVKIKDSDPEPKIREAAEPVKPIDEPKIIEPEPELPAAKTEPAEKHQNSDFEQATLFGEDETAPKKRGRKKKTEE